VSLNEEEKRWDQRRAYNLRIFIFSLSGAFAVTVFRHRDLMMIINDAQNSKLRSLTAQKIREGRDEGISLSKQAVENKAVTRHK